MPDLNELRRATVSIEGSEYVLKTQLLKATAGPENVNAPALTEASIAELLDNLSNGTKAAMAWEIADMHDNSARNVKAKSQNTDNEQNPPTGSNA